MACSFSNAFFPQGLSYAITAAALELEATDTLTIVGWVKSSGAGSDTIATVMADDGAADCFTARRRLEENFCAEMNVNGVSENATIAGAPDDIWYFVEWEISTTQRKVRFNNGAPETNSDPLGAPTPFTNLTIGVGRHPGLGPAEFTGCLAEIAFINRVLTDDEREDLAAGYIPPLVFGSENIPFYVPLEDGDTAAQAYHFGDPVTMDFVTTSPGTCFDGPDLITELPDEEGLVGGSGMQLEPVGCIITAQVYALEVRDLNSILELGPFRFVEQKDSDETSMVTTLVIGLTECDIGILIEIDLSTASDLSELNPAFGAIVDCDTQVDVLGDDIEIDMGEGVGNSDDYTLELLGNQDGSTYPSAPIEFMPEVLEPIEDRGSVKQYSPMGYSFIYHRVRLKATEIDEKFGVKFVDISGQLTGRLK